MMRISPTTFAMQLTNMRSRRRVGARVDCGKKSAKGLQFDVIESGMGESGETDVNDRRFYMMMLNCRRSRPWACWLSVIR
jgi:hypothetical protein